MYNIVSLVKLPVSFVAPMFLLSRLKLFFFKRASVSLRLEKVASSIMVGEIVVFLCNVNTVGDVGGYFVDSFLSKSC